MDKILEIADFTLDLTKVCMVGPLSFGTYKQYTVYFSGGLELNIYQEPSTMFPSMPRSVFIEHWKKVL